LEGAGKRGGGGGGKESGRDTPLPSFHPSGERRKGGEKKRTEASELLRHFAELIRGESGIRQRKRRGEGGKGRRVLASLRAGKESAVGCHGRRKKGEEEGGGGGKKNSAKFFTFPPFSTH